MIMLRKPLKGLYIAVVTPANGRICTPLVMRLIKWSSMGAEVNVIRGSLLDHARNLAVKQFMKGKKKYFLFIDDDTIPEVKDIQKLMKHNKAVIGGLYNLLITRIDGTLGTKPSAYTLIPNHTSLDGSVAVIPKTGLQEVIGMGTGYMMIHRNVFMTMPQPWFEFTWVDKEHTAFEGEDLGFCRKASELGFKLWCDTDCQAAHSKEFLI